MPRPRTSSREACSPLCKALVWEAMERQWLLPLVRQLEVRLLRREGLE